MPGPRLIPRFRKRGYVDKVLGTGPIAYWPLWEAAAPTSYLTFNGSTTNVNCGSGASLDNLMDAQATIDGWVYIDQALQTGAIANKFNHVALTGWRLRTNAGGITFHVFDNGGAGVNTGATATEIVGSWIHIAVYFNDAGARRAYLAVNGVWAPAGDVLANPIGADAGDDLKFGVISSTATQFLRGRLGWWRISNNDRFGAGVDFAAPSRTTTPTVDANTVSLWPMNEGYGSVAGDIGVNNNDGTITAGSWGAYPAARCLVNTAQNGVYTGVVLGDTAGPDGSPCPFFDGANDYVNIYSAAFNAAFNGATGTLMCWIKVANVGVWTDGLSRRPLHLYSDASNSCQLIKAGAANRLSAYDIFNGTVYQRNNDGLSGLGWYHFCQTYSDSSGAGELRLYINGTQLGATLAIAHAWTGVALSNTQTLIGATTQAPAFVFNGWIAHCAVWDRVLTPAQIADLAAV